jgi:hypothetical protein
MVDVLHLLKHVRAIHLGESLFKIQLEVASKVAINKTSANVIRNGI